MAKIARGDREELTKLYEELRRPVFLLAFSIVGETGLAEDVMQDTFLRVEERADECRSQRGSRAWVFAIARNFALNSLHRKNREQPDGALPEPAAGPPDERGLEFSEALRQLGETERMIVTLKIVCGLKHKETARLLCLSHSDVRARYSRALRTLKAYYLKNDLR